MHVPDGYLSPQTCVLLWAAMLPVWSTAVKKVKGMMQTRYVPLMVIAAAFSFIIMMFNIPIPDGTTAHAVGGGILAVILGPWGASICITISLAIQALFFGDGGILSLGANCFNMAFVLPFSAYLIYRLVAGKSEVDSPRRWIGGLLGGYVGINLAALCAGIEFGLQPILFHTANGAPLYSPYPLGMAITAMSFAHLLVAGPVEGMVTALFIRYLQSNDRSLLDLDGGQRVNPGLGRFWYGLLALAILSPLGLLAKGTAWGEWSTSEVQRQFGFVPQGMAQLADRWHALLPGYSLPGVSSFGYSSLIYLVAAVLGIGVIVALTMVLNKMVANSRAAAHKTDRGKLKE